MLIDVMSNNVELFTVDSYTGMKTELIDEVEMADGIKDVRLGTSPDRVKNAELGFDVEYDPDVIHRNSVCEVIENMRNVSGEVLCG
jgi:hypothetical protein